TTTSTKTGMMTEPGGVAEQVSSPRRIRGPWWVAVRSARGRIVGWMLLVVAIVLAGSIASTAEILSVRADNVATDALGHEADSFHTYAGTPTGRAQRSVRA